MPRQRRTFNIRHKRTVPGLRISGDYPLAHEAPCAVHDAASKAMSKKSQKPNALKHGATSGIVLLWGEKQEDFDALRASLYLEWKPDGPTEEYLVQNLLGWLWRSRRIDLYHELKIQQKLSDIRHNNKVSDIAGTLRAHAPDFEKADSKEQVEELLSALPNGYEDVIRHKWPLVEKEDPKKWGAKIAKGMASWIVTRLEGPAEFLALSDPFDIKVALIARDPIDAKIEQTTKRLVQLKAMKQAHQWLEPKLISIATKSALPQDQAEILPKKSSL
jgi:hypothetical protein